MKTHQQCLDKWIGNKYREPWIETYQCVGWVKKYCAEVYWITWLSFWGSAINGWNRMGNLDTFFQRVEIPRQWDIVFFNTTPTNPYWHVAIYNTQNTIVEQNWWTGTGNGIGTNAIRIGKMPSNIVWYMRPIWAELDQNEKIVKEFADKFWIKWRSKVNPYTQFETLLILSKILWQK